jgi:hypothetical protein
MACNDFRDQLMETLYGEASAEARVAFEAHTLQCASCRAELESLGDLRRTLVSWKTPRFRRQTPRYARPLWGLAAAAALLLALGGAVGLAGVEFQYAKGPVTVRLGRGDATASRRAALEQRRQDEIAALKSSFAPDALPVSASSDPACARMAAQLVRASEARQMQWMRTRLTELDAQNAAQRRYDLARISASLAYLDGRSGQQLARTSELMGQVLRVSDKGE